MIKGIDERLSKVMTETVFHHVSNKEAFIRGFVIGRGLSVTGYKRFHSWRVDSNGVESFYWRDKKISEFKIKLVGGEDFNERN